MFLHVSVILFTGGGIPACIAGGSPACLAAGLQWGEWYPSMPCWFPGPHPGGKLRGLAWGGLQAHTQGWFPDPHLGVSRPTPGEVSRPTPGGCIPACTEADPRGYCCGWYASYWNAFLFGKMFTKNCMKIKEIGPGGIWHCRPIQLFYMGESRISRGKNC